MDELGAILQSWRALGPRTGEAVLATVVHVRGSAYRRPGARMLILPGGQRVGTISGGCLEGDVARKAWWYTAGGTPSLRVYDTSSDEDAVWEFGLGCNGVIQVLLERLAQRSAQQALGFAEECRQSGLGGVMAVVIRAAAGSPLVPGDRLFAGADGSRCGPLATRWPDLSAHIDDTRRQRASRLVGLPDCEVFVEWIAPPQPLVIFGAGHDAIPLAALAGQLGWAVTVADARPAYATRARFPQAQHVVVMQPDHLLADLDITGDTAVVLMTHNIVQDGRLLREILPARPRYLGLLGPARRADQIFQELGVDRTAHDIHAPIGLDIGATTPEGIALSIVSEIQAELAKRPGMRLRHRRSPIHAPATETGLLSALPPPTPEQPVCEISRTEVG